MKKKTNLGFTLIELMVVITIIAILATMGINTFTAAQKKARDSKRMSDVRTLLACAASTADMQGSYQATGLAHTSLADACPNHPTKDPGGISYDLVGTNIGICVCTKLEVDGSGNAADNNGCDGTDGEPRSTPTAIGEDFFCVGI